jgi:hypothetical protein
MPKLIVLLLSCCALIHAIEYYENSIVKANTPDPGFTMPSHV